MKKILSLLIVLQIIYANNSFTSFKVPFFSNSASLSNNISCVNNGSANNFTNPSLLNYLKKIIYFHLKSNFLCTKQNGI